MYREEANDEPILVVACQGRVFGVDRESGEKRWEVLITEDTDIYTPGFAVELLVTPHRVYAAAWMSDDLVCIGYPDGAEIGRAKIGLRSVGRAAMILDKEQLFVARAGEVACFSLDGQPRWKSSLVDDGPHLPVSLGFPGNVRQGDDRKV